ncbi:hypothetical protein Droror1_Dr00020475 [Drosera rotundifolia]
MNLSPWFPPKPTHQIVPRRPQPKHQFSAFPNPFLLLLSAAEFLLLLLSLSFSFSSPSPLLASIRIVLGLRNLSGGLVSIVGAIVRAFKLFDCRPHPRRYPSPSLSKTKESMTQTVARVSRAIRLQLWCNVAGDCER